LLRRSLPFFGIVLLSLLPSSALAADAVPVSRWEAQAGDVFLVDVPQNMGYLIHENGEFLPFPVATGRKAVVRYIGRTYQADTPIRTWTAEQKQIKGDRRTFGVSGRFIRLFRDGESSPYGIHSYFKIADWMREDERYFSMGCIVVTEEMLDVIEKTFTLNDQNMTVITTNDAQAVLQDLVSSSHEERDS